MVAFPEQLPPKLGCFLMGKEVCSCPPCPPRKINARAAAGIVRWVCAEVEYGVETLVIDDDSGEDMEGYLW